MYFQLRLSMASSIIVLLLHFLTAHAQNAYQPPSELYCFPPSSSRQRYTGVWGKYTVEVKEGDTCGPSDNWFTSSTVSVNGDELKLQFKQVGGRWLASEVRVLLPSNEYFDYGTYTFSVKSVQVIDVRDGQVVDTKLPPSLVLGLFTWDATEDYASHENYNHEVDVELSQWNKIGDKDVQFLVQPIGSPQLHRFFSGRQPSTYQEAPNSYGFEWRPAEVRWFSSAGGGESFTYNTQAALDAKQPDYTQCMPAQVEVRINLWNLLGSFVQPTNLQDYHIVEAVIDNFEFKPSGLVAVPTGGVCSKDCQCGGAANCIGNRCATTTNGGSGGGGGGTGGADSGGGSAGGSRACFSAMSSVHVLGKGPIPMKDLQVNDKVYTGSDNQGKPLFQSVYCFGHLHESISTEYIKIFYRMNSTIQDAVSIEISVAHLIYLAHQSDPVRADGIQVGDKLLMQTIENVIPRIVIVTRIEKITRHGAYQPLTPSGTIIVDDIVASAYVSIEHDAPHLVGLLGPISQQTLFHWWLAPYRMLCMELFPSVCKHNLNEEGINYWLGIGQSLAEFWDCQHSVLRAPGLCVVLSLLCIVNTVEYIIFQIHLGPILFVAALLSIKVFVNTGTSISS